MAKPSSKFLQDYWQNAQLPALCRHGHQQVHLCSSCQMFTLLCVIKRNELTGLCKDIFRVISNMLNDYYGTPIYQVTYTSNIGLNCYPLPALTFNLDNYAELCLEIPGLVTNNKHPVVLPAEAA